MLRPYAVEGWQDAAATRMMAGARARAGAGAPDRGLAHRRSGRRSRAHSRPRPWYDLGKALRFPRATLRGALAAYAKGDPRATSRTGAACWRAHGSLPVTEGGDAAFRAIRQADRASWRRDPWLVLEIAWRELPPPRTDEVLLARNDYGAVRGMFHPRGIDADVTSAARCGHATKRVA